MTELSPAAQAVAKAALKASSFCKDETCPYKGEEIAAAVLRAVAEQVPDLPKNCSSYDVNVQDGREEVRSFLLTIVDELEAQ